MNRPKIIDGIVALAEPLSPQEERGRLAALDDDALKAELHEIALSKPFDVWDLGLTQEDVGEVDYIA